ncbi:Na/Pi cotransporter family protein [Serratia odorifera]|uniref:Na/Pi-cotransporter II-like protein n=2 Tax=Serratia odorifera TaxID=618 RepID=D4E0J0_SEROD|nr:Na/Pi cotransporter family protein [Serratia odorifera]EFE96639.1 Na/Pi-cotransporter II-like protein [Serratia odorifera DSM 4582]MBJ2067061.1 Na/Pi cotransporter family protein [Serratia odorifera]PNK91238.1 Na/Pi cotransporter family protein [Serratia odorifera]RII72307.1 Na/Pi cotransporter family protein [Serratia odorifera]VDZ56498.1 sodium-dependent inorganic phosphate (Pi) transporter [Serratia odorifera]
MLTLLHLLSAVALLVWGTHIVRTGIMRVYGANLRRVLSNSVEKKPLAFASGIGVTALVQSSNATALLVTSFVAQGLVGLAPALVIMLGADVGTALMARVLTFDLSWLSPLLIFVGVIFFLSRKQTRAGQMGRVSIGLGLIVLALELIVAAATPITQAAGVKVLFSSLTGDVMLDALTGALFAIISYSSLAAVLLTATLTASGVISLKVALCLVIGANLGSGLLATINTSGQNAAGRRVALGSLLFKLLGSALVLPFVSYLADAMEKLPGQGEELVIYFHVFYNLIRCLIFIPLAAPMARLCQMLIADAPEDDPRLRPRHLDPSALDTPSLALANAARETLRMGDVVEHMLILHHEVLHGKLGQDKEVRRLDDDVDVLYTAIKLYLAQIQKEDLGEEDSRRWAEIIEMALNLEQAGDIIERMTGDVAAKSHAARRAFSPEGLTELDALHERLVTNLRLSLSVFLSSDLTSAKRLRRSKHRFRILDRRYAHAHVDRLHQQNVQSMETSSLHLGLLGDMKRLNSLFCAVAYNVLDQDQRDDERDWEDTPSTL